VKLITKSLIAFFALTSMHGLMAQQPQVNPSVSLPDLKGTIGIQAGTYEFFDPTKSQMAILEEITKRSKEDAEFYLAWVSKRNNEWAEIIKMVHAANGSLQQMSDDSSQGAGPIDSVEFLTKTRAFRQRMEEFANEVGSFGTLAGAFSPSAVKLTQNEDNRPVVEQIQQRMNLAAAEPVARYLAQMKKLEDHAKALPFRVKLRDGRITDVTNLVIDKGPVYSDKEIADMNEQIYRWRNYGPTDKPVVVTFNDELRLRIMDFIEKYGRQDRFTSRNDVDMKAFVETIGEISVMFWAKDFYRALGLQMGAITAEYEKSWFELDRFKAARNIVTFHQQVAFGNRAMDTLKKNYVEAVQTARDKKMRLTKSGTKEELEEFALLESKIGSTSDDYSQQIANDDVTVFAYANSFITMVAGSRAVADAYYWLLTLLLNDVQSEITLITKGQMAMANRYRASWTDASPARAKEAKENRELYFPIAKKPAPGERPTRTPMGGAPVGDASGLPALMQSMRNLYGKKQRDLNLAMEQELVVYNAGLLGNAGNDVTPEEIDILEGPKKTPVEKK